MPSSNLQTAYNYFVSQGDSPAASAGIASGLYAESQLNPNNFNPASGATGIGQWLSSRLIALEDYFGSNPTLQDQLQFVQMELTGTAGTGNQGGSIILSDTSASQALSDFITKFERPKAGYETTSDISRGTTALGSINTGSSIISASNGVANVSPVLGSNATLTPFQVGVQDLVNDPGQFFGTLFGGGITPSDIVTNGISSSAQLAGSGMNTVTGNAGANIAGSVASGVGSAIAPLTNWLTGLTSSDTVTRVAVGLVAVILLGAGLFFLAGNRNMTLNVTSLKGAMA